MAPTLGASRAHLTFRIRVSLLASLTACAAPAPAPIEPDALAADVVARGATAEHVALALELADLRALPFERPRVEGEPDYDQGDFWYASALAFNGALVDARRQFGAASARARSAGAPDAAVLEVEHLGTGSDRETFAALTFDLLGLLDAGRSKAAHELARAEARAAFSDVESAAWAARFAVDRARTELGHSLAQVDELTRLLATAEASRVRAEHLFAHGRVSDGELARLRAKVFEVEHDLHEQWVHVALHRRELADAAGLPPSAPALDAPTRSTLDLLLARAVLPPLPSARELLERSPPVRRARLEYALAEALLRDEVARTRPGLRLGPALELTVDDSLLGGMLVLDLPHARALSARVGAALEVREGAREALEETLRAELARIEEQRARFDEAIAALAEHVVPRAVESEREWRAARARFDVDPLRAEEVGMALRDRAMALGSLWEVRHEAVLAWLDLEEAIGPAGPQPTDGASTGAGDGGPAAARPATPATERLPDAEPRSRGVRR